jgi:hypothetical protein
MTTRQYSITGKVVAASGLLGWALRGNTLRGMIAMTSEPLDFKTKLLFMMWFGIESCGGLKLMEGHKGEVLPMAGKLYLEFTGLKGRVIYVTVDTTEDVILRGTVVISGRGMDGLCYRHLEAEFTAIRSKEQ